MTQQIKYFSWFMKSRNKFATCRGVDEWDYYDEWSGKFKTFKSNERHSTNAKEVLHNLLCKKT